MLHENLNTHTKFGLFIVLIVFLIIVTILTQKYRKKIKNKNNANITIVIITFLWVYFAFIFKKIFTLDIYEEEDTHSSQYIEDQPNMIQQSNSKKIPSTERLEELHKLLNNNKIKSLSPEQLNEVIDKIHSDNRDERFLSMHVFEKNIIKILYDGTDITPEYIKYIIETMEDLSKTDHVMKIYLNDLKTHLENYYRTNFK
jgi:heme/copper-type cytochrome/quinol oxidase subunit 2